MNRFYIVYVRDGRPRILPLDAETAGRALEEAEKFIGPVESQTIFIFDEYPVFVYHGRWDGEDGVGKRALAGGRL